MRIIQQVAKNVLGERDCNKCPLYKKHEVSEFSVACSEIIEELLGIEYPFDHVCCQEDDIIDDEKIINFWKQFLIKTENKI